MGGTSRRFTAMDRAAILARTDELTARIA